MLSTLWSNLGKVIGLGAEKDPDSQEIIKLVIPRSNDQNIWVTHREKKRVS